MPANSKEENGPKMDDLPAPPKDLMDFYIRWKEFRPIVQSIEKLPGLTQEQRQAFKWLIALSDRVRKDDL